MRLKDKVIVLTGGSGLIGRALIEKIRQEGAMCVNVDLATETNEEFTEVKCDVTDALSIERTINDIIERFGRIDGLVNNAYPRTPDWGSRFEDVTYASWVKNMDMQLNSTFVFCKCVLAHMKSRSSGTIVNIASMYGVVAPDFTVYDGTSLTSPVAYSAIKGGLIHFTKYLASYFGPHGIRANAVSPGGVFDSQHPVFVSNYERKVPLRRMAVPADMAGPVAFLLSDEASYITGQNLIVDGGWTIV
jgi:NAD(P)-dependent dehydrogenase (short-subunit alcohol dehydrogenase family)